MGVELLNVQGLELLPPEQPVIMVNLMRFHQRAGDGNGSGWDAYLRYSALTIPLIKARGATIVWAGRGQAVALGRPQADAWDYVALVRYPRVAAFLDMMTSPEYVNEADVQRRHACREHVIVATAETYSKMRI
jgi:uncharacterized protein (DUF1330 family)